MHSSLPIKMTLSAKIGSFIIYIITFQALPIQHILLLMFMLINLDGSKPAKCYKHCA